MPDGTAGEVVHLHSDSEVFKVVKELKERPELFKSDALCEKKERKVIIQSQTGSHDIITSLCLMVFFFLTQPGFNYDN